MHFDIANIQGIYISVSDYSLEHGSLVPFVGPCDGIRLATMICVCSSNDAKNGIVVCLCVFQPLKNDSPNGICPAVATSRIVECIAIT